MFPLEFNKKCIFVLIDIFKYMHAQLVRVSEIFLRKITLLNGYVTLDPYPIQYVIYLDTQVWIKIKLYTYPYHYAKSFKENAWLCMVLKSQTWVILIHLDKPNPSIISQTPKYSRIITLWSISAIKYILRFKIWTRSNSDNPTFLVFDQLLLFVWHISSPLSL